MIPIASAAALTSLWRQAEGDASALDRVTFTASGPGLPSSFDVDAMAMASIAAAGLAAAEVHRARSGYTQTVTVERAHAATEFRSERHLKIEGPPPAFWDPIAGLYPTGDGRHVRIHTNFAHHRDGVLALLGCENTREAVQAALREWRADDFETAAAERGLVATMTRSLEEWAQHPQGHAVAALPPFEIMRIGAAPAKHRPADERPLSGIRVLDLTRIIAGPVAGRTLAAHGADVMLVTSPKLPAIPVLVIDTGRGKLSAHIDLDTVEGRATLRALVREADVFIQGYRPGGLAARGFSPEELAAINPGIVACTLDAYGHAGPWAGRRGFDSLTQNANGLNVAEAEAAGQARPKELPAQALDHAAGYVLAFGAMMALGRQLGEGGSWHVRTSLAQMGEWLKRLGRVEGGLARTEPTAADVAPFLDETSSGFGRITAVRHAAQLSLTPAHWALPTVPLGTHRPVWPAAG